MEKQTYECSSKIIRKRKERKLTFKDMPEKLASNRNQMVNGEKEFYED